MTRDKIFTLIENGDKKAAFKLYFNDYVYSGGSMSFDYNITLGSHHEKYNKPNQQCQGSRESDRRGTALHRSCLSFKERIWPVGG